MAAVEAADNRPDREAAEKSAHLGSSLTFVTEAGLARA